MAEGHSAMQEAAADCSESQQGLKLGDARSEEQAVELSSVFHPVDVTAIEFTAKLELNGTAHGSAATAAAVSAPAGEVSSPSTPAKPAAATAAAAAARAPSAAPVATQTPVERRQWLRAAQRSMRLSVTAFKDARSRAGSASSRGTGVATQLSNDLLTEQNIQGVELPATLKQVPGIQQAGVAKLQRRQQQHLQDLAQAVSDFAQAVEDMVTAFRDVMLQLPSDATEGAGTVPGSSSSSCWQCSVPVFNYLNLSEVLQLLQQVLTMHQKELLLKHDLLACFEKIVSGPANDASSNGSGSSSSSSHAVGRGGRLNVKGPDGLSRQLTAAVTTWMVRPYIDDDVANHLLQVLTDDMTGF